MFSMKVLKSFDNCRLILTLFLSVLALFASPVLAVQYPLADKVPASAFWYNGYNGKAVQIEHSEALGFLNIMKQGKIGRVLFDIAKSQSKNAHDEAMNTGIGNILEIALKHPMAFYTYGWEKDTDGEPLGLSAFIIDLEEDMPEFSRNFNDIVTAVKTKEQVTYIQRQGQSFTVVHNDEIQLDYFMGFVGQFFIATNDPDQIDIIAGNINSPQNTLAENPKFKKSMENINSSDNFVFASYIDVPVTAKSFISVKGINTIADQRAIQIWPYLGLDKIEAIVAAGTPVQNRIVSKIKVITPAPHEGLLKFLIPNSDPQTRVDDLPADSNFLVVANMDLSKILEEIRKTISVMNPAGVMQLEQALQMASGYLGMSIEEKVLSNLGPRVILVNSLSAGGAVSPVIMIDVKNSEAFEQFLTRIESFATGFANTMKMQRGKAPFRILSGQVGQTKLSALQFTIDKPIPVNPTWALYKDKLIIGPWPSVVESVVSGNMELGLEKNGSFAEMKGLLDKKTQAFIYADSRALYRQLYFLSSMAYSMLANMQGDSDLKIDPLLMPMISEMDAFPANGIVGVWAEDDGIVIKCSGISNIVAPVYTVAATAAIPAIMLPALSKAKEMARVAAVKSGLRAIYQGAELYRMDNRLLSPDNLDQLAKYLDVEGKLFVSPRSKKQYIYLKLPANSNYELIQAYDAKPYNGKVLVVQAGGMVSAMEMSKFKELLAETQKFLKSFNEKYKNAQ